MNKKLFLVAALFLALGTPAVTQAAFNFGSISTDQLYFPADQNSIVVTQTRTDPYAFISPPTWATCEYEAGQAGLSESNNYWCVQKAVLGSIFENNCVFLCQVGVGSGINSTPTQASMTTYLFSAPPVGYPLSYYNNASQGQKNAMDASVMCLMMPAFGYGCELKKHTPVNVAPAVSMTANPTSILSGASSALTWSSTNATSCSLNQGIGGVATTGTRSVSPSGTTTYTVSCTGAGGTATASATVTVLPLTTATLTRTPASVVSGSSATLTWSSTNANICVGNGFDTLGATSGTVSTGALSSTTNYSVTCTGPSVGDTAGTWQADGTDVSDLSCPATSSNNVYSVVPNCPVNPSGKTCNTSTSNVCKVNVVSNGANCLVTTSLYQCRGGGITPGSSAIAFATVVVTAPAAPTATLSAAPTSIVSGSASTLTWSSTNATSCSLNQGIGSVGTSGTRSVSPTATTAYTVTCTGVGGTASDVKTVTVTTPAVPTATLTASPTSVEKGSSATLTWSSTNASSCTGTGFSAGGATSGSVSTGALTATTNYSVSCTGTGGTGTDTETVTVTNASLPDLTAGVVSPSTATEDSAVTLSSSVVNGGSRATGTSFPNIFQIENGAIISANTVPFMAAGASSVLSTSHTFTSAGTYRVRACVDNNTSWVGSVTESDENNNCGAYTSITVNACSGVGCTGYPGTLSCSVSNSNPLVGQTVTYTATPGGGATGPYVWTPSDGATGLGTGATASRSFPNPGDYTMNVSSATGASASCTPRVSVGCGTASASISASPTRVYSGAASTLTVPALSGVDGTCTVTGPGVSRTLTASGCAVPATSFSTGPITTLSTYTITCDNEPPAKVIVNVVPAFQEF